jgi:hypothetical protein
MAIKIVLSDKVKLKIKGSYVNENGGDSPFDFTMTMKRLSAEKIKEELENSEKTVVQFLADLTHDWSDVLDGTGQQIAWSKESFEMLCGNIHNLGQIILTTYLSEVGAKAKN